MRPPNLTPSLWLTLSLSGLILALGLVPGWSLPLLEFQRSAIDSGQWWRLLSGQLVHYGGYHLLMNVLALLLIGYVLLRAQPVAHCAGLLLCSALGVAGGLYWGAAQLDYYAGFSGVLHGLLVAGLLLTLRETPLFNGLALVVVLFKLVHEQSADFDPSHPLLPVPIAVDAHGYGALAGALFALALVLYRRWRR